MLKSKVKALQHHKSVTEKNFCETMSHVRGNEEIDCNITLSVVSHVHDGYTNLTLNLC